jgi:hypothetical protein
LCGVASAHAEPFSAHALRGIQHINVAVSGVDDNFTRYGFTSVALRQRVEQRLHTAGIDIADDETAAHDPLAGQLQIKLTTVETVYAYYSYAMAAQAQRKIPLGDSGGFTSQNVWSVGQSGVVNPSDLRTLYEVADQLVDQFIAAHGVDNVAHAAPPS